MALLEIRTYGDKILRKKAKPVENIDNNLETLAHNMLETMYDAPGIGLAAPQVGEDIQLIVVDVLENEENNPHILFNPEIKESSGEAVFEEGCLSFPGIFVNISRPDIITVKAQNEKGEEILLENIEGLLSRCIQHEMDHLNGVLLVDKISAMDKMLLEGKLKKLVKQKRK